MLLPSAVVKQRRVPVSPKCAGLTEKGVSVSPGTRGPKDQRTRGPGDQRTGGPEVQRTGGSEDQRTTGPEDQRTRDSHRGDKHAG